VPFFSAVQVFKYQNNKYEPQGKLGLAILSSQVSGQNQYRILMYVTKSQPVATIRLNPDFKLSVQKNNYGSFYDESKQLWSVLFDNEDLVATFATQITLCKCNLLLSSGNTNDAVKLVQDLKVNDNDAQTVIEPGDAIECGVNVVLWKDFKLGNELENTIQKPVKLKLGKNKLPSHIENVIVGMRQDNRRLFVVNGSHLQSFYPNSLNSTSASIVFYDINIIRIKKNKETASTSMTNSQIDMSDANSISNTPPRSRAESTIKDKSKIINEQLNENKLNEKAKLISRMAKMGQQMLPGSGAGNESYSMVNENEEEWDKTNTAATMLVNSNNIQDFSSNSVQAALLLQQQQNQQLQQQLAMQQQQQQQQQQQFAMQQANSLNQTSNNQLALCIIYIIYYILPIILT
jgi:FK506-binding protein 15